jgi:hypothetical protein
VIIIIPKVAFNTVGAFNYCVCAEVYSV